MRVSGKKALVQLQWGTAETLDLSGVGSDGRSRANDFQFTISADTAEAIGYNEDYKETVALGQSAVEGSMTVFYNAAANEVEDVLWTMWEAQHQVADCGEVGEYTLVIMPEGNCPGATEWEISNVVLKTLEFPIKFGEILVINFSWSGWQVTRSTIAAS
jgi:hypothetical protein